MSSINPVTDLNHEVMNGFLTYVSGNQEDSKIRSAVAVYAEFSANMALVSAFVRLYEEPQFERFKASRVRWQKFRTHAKIRGCRTTQSKR